MKALLDTCVIIDLLQKREPFFDAAHRIFLLSANERFEGFISAKAVTDVYYLMHRHYHDNTKTRDAVGKLLKLFAVLDTMGADARKALLSPVTDFEDALMVETAARSGTDCIVTRNTGDYKKSVIPVYSPETFLSMFTDV